MPFRSSLSRLTRLTPLAGLVLALLLSVPAWLPWLDPRMDLWRADDAKNHMLRLYHLQFLLERGVWHPRWVPDLFMGYGYPVLNFYAPAFYYLSLALGAALRLDVWDSFRVGGVFTILIGGTGVYALTHALWRRPALSVLAVLVLLYEPYVFQVNVFKRADLPETLALGLIPWLLLALYRLWLAPSRPAQVTWFTATTAAGALVLLAHNLTALAAAAMAAIWVLALLLMRPSWRSFARASLAGLAALSLAGFFVLPAMSEGRLVQLEELWGTGGLDWRGWFVEPTGLTDKDEKPDNRQTRGGWIDRNLQYPHLLISAPKISLGQAGLGAMTGALLVITLARRPGAWRSVVPAGTLFLTGLGCWFLTFSVSAPLWEHVPGLELFQFPWRFLGPLGLCLAIAAPGALAVALRADDRPQTTNDRPVIADPATVDRRSSVVDWGIVALLGALFVANSIGARQFPFSASPDRRIDGAAVVVDERHDYVGAGTTTGNREFLPRHVFVAVYTHGFPRHVGVYELLYPDADWLGGLLLPMGGDLRLLGWRAESLRLSVRVANDGQAAGAMGVRQLFFAGWRAWIDGKSAEIAVPEYIPEQQASPGVMVLAVPPGEHTLSLSFGPSAIRVLAVGATLAGAWALAAGLLLWTRPHRTRGEALLCAGAALLALAAAYGAWRAVRPALGRHTLSTPAALAAEGAWRAPDLDAWGAGLVVNVAEAARTGQARIASPSGQTLGPDRFVDVRQLTVADANPLRGAAGTSRREWLYMHPPADVSVDVALPARKQVWFQAGLALDPRVWTAEVGDGVQFRVSVQPLAGGASELVLDQAFNPRADTAQRRWVPVRIDLSRWAGQTVRLTLSTLPRDDASFDWAGWGNPVVVVADTARDVLAAEGRRP